MFSNISLGVFNSLILKLIIPFSLFQFANLCKASSWGVFNNLPQLDNGGVVSIVISILLLDILIYWQHRVTHLIPILWRLHAVHHSDIELDTTSGIRFHPIEIICSYVVKAGFILALGLPAMSILIFEIILSTSSLFNHSNFSFPPRLEKILRYLIVTPTMHRIHHSTVVKETNSNYSFSFSIWDRVFSSYTEKAALPQKTMDIGLKEYRESSDQNIVNLILQPFKRKT